MNKRMRVSERLTIRSAEFSPLTDGAYWILSALLAVACLMGVGFLFNPELPETKEKIVSVPMVSYLPAGNAASSNTVVEDVRVLWSPVLFSLSTPVGFSKPVLTGDAGAKPPVMEPDFPVRFLESDTVTVRGHDASLVTTPDDLDHYIFEYPGEPVHFRVYSPSISGRLPAIDIQQHGELEQVEFEEMPDWSTVAKGGDPFQIDIHVEFTRYGGVQHALIEHSTASDTINRKALSLVRGLRLKQVGEAIVGSLTIQSRGGVSVHKQQKGGRSL